MQGGDVEDSADLRWLDNQAEGLIVVHAVLLGETTQMTQRAFCRASYLLVWYLCL